MILRALLKIKSQLNIPDGEDSLQELDAENSGGPNVEQSPKLHGHSAAASRPYCLDA
jgi:hypothetical protein